jgi:hypothetical protein
MADFLAILRGNPDRSYVEASDKSAHLAAERDNYQPPVRLVSVDRDGVHVEVVMFEPGMYEVVETYLPSDRSS